MSNYDDVNKGFDLLIKVMAPCVAKDLVLAYGQADWWQKGVLDKLSDLQRRSLTNSTDPVKRAESLDVAACLRLVEANWREVFRGCLPPKARTWSHELADIRNEIAHRGMRDLPDDDAWRALDTMARFAESFDAGADGEGGNVEKARRIAEQIREIRRTSREQVAAPVPAPAQVVSAAPTSSSEIFQSTSNTPYVEGLPSWRDVMLPNTDVMQGRYSKAEFAADLDKVAKNEADSEYQDPVEFFARTYVTEGMKGLLVQALKRVCDKGGEPVIQLKTAFGGGKTHSMLALYHLLRGRAPLEKIEHLKPVLEAAGVDVPPHVHVAAIVGTVPDPATRRKPAELPGVQIGTLWGEIAAQLAISAGRPELYEYVREADKRGIAPGSEALRQLFDDCGPCLVLIDELVAYARKLWKKDDAKLPAGTFGNILTFVQEITEAAKSSKNSLVVASIPESDSELGGEGGREVLRAIEHTFGRVESIWQPVTHNEGFEVVRRRLFKDCANPEARDRVCQAFSSFYQQNAEDFPPEAHELEYMRRMKACYPIHPEVFDRLYEDWATLEKFQRTRGVLRLMAGVIHKLWMASDPAPMIMPGSLPIDVTDVRDELIRYLPDSQSWNAIVNSEVDGTSSVAYKADKENSRYGGRMAARRSARAIMLGSAPDVSGQQTRGIEKSRVLLGVVQPGEYVSTFNDAMGELTRRSSYLNTDSNARRFWYDTRPNLRKVVEDRMHQMSAGKVQELIEKRMAKAHKPPQLGGVHVAPVSSADVPDEQAVRLVLLPYGTPFQRMAGGENPAFAAVREMVENRGSSPRAWRNTLVFLAADHVMVSQMVDCAKRMLAWESIKNEHEELNLTARQVREASDGIDSSSRELETAIGNAYCWLIVPFIDRGAGTMAIELQEQKINGSSLADQMKNAVSQLVSNGDLITQWAARLLAAELKTVLWREGANHTEVKVLWDTLCKYCYMPRLLDFSVLERTLRDGAASDAEPFALASGLRADGSYADLRLGREVMGVRPSDYVLRAEVAKAQIEREREEEPPVVTPPGTLPKTPPTTPPGHPPVPPEPPKPKDPVHFSMSAPVGTERMTRDIMHIVEEVLEHVVMVPGGTARINIEVELDAPAGIPAPTVRTLKENCKNLGILGVDFY